MPANLPLSYLLVGALLLWWLRQAATREPTLRRCRHCDDAVYYVPGLPTRCPTCKRITLI